MAKLLLRLFVKNCEDVENPEIRASVGRFAGTVGILCNILLFAGKAAAGFAAGSVSVIADAINNLSDIASSLVALIGFKMVMRPADKEHPYGHARAEYLSGLVIAAFIIMIGGALIKTSVEKIINPDTVRFSVLTFGILVFSAFLKLWMFTFYRFLGKSIRSTVLLAAAIDSRNDVISTLAVLFGGLLVFFFDLALDGYIGLLVAIFIVYSGIAAAKETLSSLLGKQADVELMQKISDLVLSHEEILGLHDLLVHDYGPGRYFASVHVELSAEKNCIMLHDIIDGIERQAMEELYVNLVIHCDPVPVNDEELWYMRNMVSETIKEIDPSLSLHDFRLVRDSQKTKLIFDLAVPFSFEVKEETLKSLIDRRIQSEGQYETVITFDREG